jgi:small subunit ribosomal protein S19
MSRSARKGPYIDEKLMKKVMAQKEGAARDQIQTWARACQIPPEFVGHVFGVHNGKNFITVKVNESMVGHRLGEFSPTRHFKGHGRIVSREISKT